MKFNFEKLGKTALVGIAALGLSKGVAAKDIGDSSTFKNPTESAIKKNTNIVENKKSPENHQVITNSHRDAWNRYMAWLDKKGMRGNPALDKGGLGYKYFDEYVRTNETVLNRDLLPALCEEFEKLRTWSLERIDKGEAVFEGKKENFMKKVSENEITKHPYYPGSRFSSYFPKEYMIYIEKTKQDNKVSQKILKTEDKGYVKTVDYNEALTSYNKTRDSNEQ